MYGRFGAVRAFLYIFMSILGGSRVLKIMDKSTIRHPFHCDQLTKGDSRRYFAFGVQNK